jgi:hypothetical protein
MINLQVVVNVNPGSWRKEAASTAACASTRGQMAPFDQRRERDTDGDGVGNLADGLEQGRAGQHVREMGHSEQNRRHDDRPPLT